MDGGQAKCTKIARFPAVAAAIFTTPPQNCDFLAPRCVISLRSEIASERRFSLRLKRAKWIPTAGIPAIPESAVKIASDWRCAILVHSGAKQSFIPCSCLGKHLKNRQKVSRVKTIVEIFRKVSHRAKTSKAVNVSIPCQAQICQSGSFSEGHDLGIRCQCQCQV